MTFPTFGDFLVSHFFFFFFFFFIFVENKIFKLHACSSDSLLRHFPNFSNVRFSHRNKRLREMEFVGITQQGIPPLCEKITKVDSFSLQGIVFKSLRRARKKYRWYLWFGNGHSVWHFRFSIGNLAELKTGYILIKDMRLERVAHLRETSHVRFLITLLTRSTRVSQGDVIFLTE